MTELCGVVAPDPAVKGVARLLDPDGPARFVRDLSEQVRITPPVTVTVVKQRPGQRAVLRIEERAAPGGRSWYAKLSRRSQAGDPAALDRLALLSKQARACGVDVPAPVAYLERFRAVIVPAAPGAGCLEAPVDRSARRETFERIGEAIERLHARLPLPAEVRTQSFEREAVERAALGLEQDRPDWVEALRDRVASWARCVPAGESAERAHLSAIHGDFYPAQVLVHTSGRGAPPLLSILDWDGYCAGRAERDVANFEAHLLLESARDRLDQEEVEALRRSFLAGVRSVRPVDDAWHVWYLRGSLLRLAALHARPGFGAHPPNPPHLASRLLSFS